MKLSWHLKQLVQNAGIRLPLQKNTNSVCLSDALGAKSLNNFNIRFNLSKANYTHGKYSGCSRPAKCWQKYFF